MRSEARPNENRFTPAQLKKMFALIRKSVSAYPKAMLFELRDRGYNSLFEQLCACLISIRTLDEVSLWAALRLFGKAREPAALYGLPESDIADLIHGSTFAHQKAARLREIARRTLVHHDGELPCNFAALVDLPGVGPKCANLALGIACDQASIGVDIHVHRITNRWGFVHAPTPEKTMKQLEVKLPRKHWVEINELLVPFGKHICTGRAPKCSVCPVREFCARVGVISHR